MEVQSIDITQIRPYSRNPRKNDKSIKLLQKSIQQYGFTQPITVDSEMTILTGHSRYFAARALGITHIPTIIITNLTPNQAAQFRIADNAAADHTYFDSNALANKMAQDDYRIDQDFQDFWKTSQIIPTYENYTKPNFTNTAPTNTPTNTPTSPHNEQKTTNPTQPPHNNQNHQQSQLNNSYDQDDQDYEDDDQDWDYPQEDYPQPQQPISTQTKYACMCPNCLGEFSIDHLLSNKE